MIHRLFDEIRRTVELASELAGALRFDQGPLFSSNERKKGYYMIYSQPTIQQS